MYRRLVGSGLPVWFTVTTVPLIASVPCWGRELVLRRMSRARALLPLKVILAVLVPLGLRRMLSQGTLLCKVQVQEGAAMTLKTTMVGASATLITGWSTLTPQAAPPPLSAIDTTGLLGSLVDNCMVPLIRPGWVGVN